MNTKNRRVVVILLICVATLYCGWFVLTKQRRIALSNGFELEYIGDNTSRIIKDGKTVFGPGGIEVEDKGPFIIGMCLDADTYQPHWFIIDKKTGRFHDGDSLHQLMINSNMSGYVDVEMCRSLHLMSFQSLKLLK